MKELAVEFKDLPYPEHDYIDDSEESDEDWVAQTLKEIMSNQGRGHGDYQSAEIAQAEVALVTYARQRAAKLAALYASEDPF